MKTNLMRTVSVIIMLLLCGCTGAVSTPISIIETATKLCEVNGGLGAIKSTVFVQVVRHDIRCNNNAIFHINEKGEVI
jgi:hypothetical protein